MRILILDNEFPPMGGGTAIINYHAMVELDKLEQVQVDLVTSSCTRDQPEVERFGARSRILRVPVNNKNIHHSSNVELLKYAFGAFLRSCRLTREQRYDICWAYATVPAGAVALALRLVAGLPYIVITQGADIPWYERRYFWLYPVLWPVIRLIWHYAAVVTAQSEASRQLIRRASPGLAVRIIRNGVDFARFTPTPEVLAQRGSRQPLTFTCVGRLIERKGQQHLLEAASELCRRGYRGRFRVQLIGDGDNRRQLQKQCAELGLQEVVVFAGVVPHAEMPQRYAESDVFVLPSYNEGMSVALLEAVAAGLPVVVTETGGTAELVEHNGLIVPWANPVALADALETFLRGPVMLRETSQRMREVQDQFTWGAYARAYLALSRNAVAGRSRV